MRSSARHSPHSFEGRQKSGSRASPRPSKELGPIPLAFRQQYDVSAQWSATASMERPQMQELMRRIRVRTPTPLAGPCGRGKALRFHGPDGGGAGAPRLDINPLKHHMKFAVMEVRFGVAEAR